MTPTLHPQAELLRRDLTADRTPPVAALSPTAVRAASRNRFIRSEIPELAGGVREIEIADPESHLPIRVYEPDGGSYPVIVYFHGGGWVQGDLDTHDEP